MSFKIKDFCSVKEPETTSGHFKLAESMTISEMNPDFVVLGEDGFFHLDEAELHESEVREVGSDEGHHDPFGNEYEHVHKHQFI